MEVTREWFRENKEKVDALYQQQRIKEDSPFLQGMEPSYRKSYMEAYNEKLHAELWYQVTGTEWR